MKNRISKSAFSLIELLITTSLIAMIAVVIFLTFSGGLNIYRRIQSYAGTQTDVLLAFEKLERDVRNVCIFSGIDFVGDTKEIAFAGVVQNSDIEGNPHILLGEISYYLDEKTKTLVRGEQDYPHFVSGAGGTGQGIFKPLASVEDVNFSYCYFNLETGRYDWKSSWSAGEGIPRRIKAQITFKDIDKTVKMDRTVFIPVEG